MFNWLVHNKSDKVQKDNTDTDAVILVKFSQIKPKQEWIKWIYICYPRTIIYM